MSRKYISDRQKKLFGSISEFDELIFAAGPQGISANMSEKFAVQSFPDEDRLVVGDGTFHVHIDWSRLKRVEITSIQIEARTEGVISFFDGNERLFHLYRQQGVFPAEIQKYDGLLVGADPS